MKKPEHTCYGQPQVTRGDNGTIFFQDGNGGGYGCVVTCKDGFEARLGTDRREPAKEIGVFAKKVDAINALISAIKIKGE